MKYPMIFLVAAEWIVPGREKEILPKVYGRRECRDSSVGRATRYRQDGPGNESL
jgi:hypothetical protein